MKYINRLFITLLMVICASYGAYGASMANSPSATGYLARGAEMYSNGNYDGCIDQLLQMRQLDPTLAQKEQALYLMAMSTLWTGDDEAITLLDAYMRTFPQSTRLQQINLARGDYYFTRAAYVQALPIYEAIPQESLTGTQIYDKSYRQAYSAMLLGHPGKAREEFTALSKSGSTYANAARFYLGYLDYLDSRHDSALHHFASVDKTRHPGTATNYYLSQIYFLRSNYQQALQYARDMLAAGKVDEFSPEMNRIAGESLYRMGRTAQAAPYLQAYVDATECPRPSACYILGIDAYNQGLYSQAAGYMRAAASDTDAMGQSAYLYLGQCYARLGNTDAALMAFENACRTGFDDKVSEAAAYNYIVARMDGGRIPFGKSVAMMEEFLSKYPRSKNANQIRENLVAGYMTDADYDSALRILAAAPDPSAKLLVSRQQVLFRLGMREFHEAHYDRALNYFRQSRSTDANAHLSLQATLWIGDCLMATDQFAEAADVYAQFINSASATTPNLTLATYNRACALYRLKQWSQAAECFGQVAAQAGPNATLRADALNRRADCLYYSGHPAEAADYYRQAFDAQPSAGDYAAFQQALMQAQLGDYPALISGMDRMIKQFPTSPLVPEAMLEKARAYEELQRIPDAIETYNDLAENYPDTSYGRNALLQLAMAWTNTGNTDRGADTYRAVIRRYPTSEEAQLAVDDLRKIHASKGSLVEFAQFLEAIPNAPRLEASAIENAAYEAAETEYLDHGNADKLKTYVSDYPTGDNMPRAAYYLAEYSVNNDKPDQALDYISTLLTEYPHSSWAEDALPLKAQAEMAQGKGNMALNTYRHLEQKASSPANLLSARMGIMRTALDLGEWDEVIAVTDRLTKSSSDGIDASPEVTWSRAVALEATGQRDQAHAMWQQLAADPADLYGARSAVALAESYLRAGNADKARATADSLINTGTPHNYWLARAFIVLSDALRQQGHTFEADEYLRSLRSNYPDRDADIYQMIDSRL